MSTDSHHFVEAQHFNFHQLELPTPSPSVAESLHYYPQEDIASQQLVTGSYFYSPVSPYSMEGSPAQNTCFGPEVGGFSFLYLCVPGSDWFVV